MRTVDVSRNGKKKDSGDTTRICKCPTQGVTIMSIFLLAASLAATASPYSPSITPSQPVAKSSGKYAIVLKTLVDQDGRRFDAARLAGKLVLVNFIFTNCGSTCPTQTMSLANFDKTLPENIRQRLMIVSISVDPRHDTPRILKAYARRFGADQARWKFLSGQPADVANVTRSFAALRPGTTDTSFHTSELRLFDGRGRMIQRYAGAPLPEQQLRRDLLALFAAA